MNLNLRPKEECTFDEISLGEIMLRLDPGEGRIKERRRGKRKKEKMKKTSENIWKICFKVLTFASAF